MEKEIDNSTVVLKAEENVGVVQIAHGVAEYGARDAPFAQFLCGQGFVVAANDHLGHGQSVIEGCPMVYLGDDDRLPGGNGGGGRKRHGGQHHQFAHEQGRREKAYQGSARDPCGGLGEGGSGSNHGVRL